MTLDEHRWQRKLAKKRKAQRRSKSVRHRTATHDVHFGEAFEPVIVVTYEITDEPLPDSAFDQLPSDVQVLINELHDKVLGARPKQALETLTALIDQYPDVTQLYNYLYIAYFNMGRREDASRMGQETIRRFPDYLFGRIALADECLVRGEPEKISDIFGGKFDLKLLYPERVRFHISEVLSFQGILAQYYFALGNQEQSERAYDLMRQLDPKHPSTRYVGRVLHPWRFLVWIRDKLKRLTQRRCFGVERKEYVDAGTERKG